MNEVFPSVTDLLPHRGTMLLVDRVLECSAHGASAEYVPRRDAWYADANGKMPAWIGIELMAQTVAVHAGLIKRREGVLPKQGALLGTRRYASTRPAFCAGRPLRIDATLIYSDAGGFCAYECRIAADGEQLASATLKVFEPDNFQTFLETSSSS